MPRPPLGRSDSRAAADRVAREEWRAPLSSCRTPASRRARHDEVGDRDQIRGKTGGTQPDAVDTGRGEPAQLLDDVVRRPDRRRARRWSSGVALFEPRPRGVRGIRRVFDEHEQIDEHPQALGIGAHIVCSRGDLGADAGGRGDVCRRDEHDVGVLGGEAVGDALVGEGRDERRTLGRARHDRGAGDREELARELDVVHALAVEEPAGLEVADDRVVLPRVGERADRLDDLAGLAERRRPGGIVLDAPGRGEAVRTVGAAAEVRALGGRRAGDDARAGPAVAGVIERLQAGGEVERLRVRGRDGGDETDPSGERRQVGGQQHGVEAPAHAVGARLGGVAASLAERERIFEGHERDARLVRRADEVAPVARRGQVAGASGLLPPGGRMPSGARPVPRRGARAPSSQTPSRVADAHAGLTVSDLTASFNSSRNAPTRTPPITLSTPRRSTDDPRRSSRGRGPPGS